MSEILTGKIVSADQYKGLLIQTEFPQNFVHREYGECLVEFLDGRPISSKQRKKAWAIMSDIARWSGETKEKTHSIFVHAFTKAHTETLKHELFGLSRANMTEAREFIEYLITFVLDFDVPLKRPLYEDLDDSIPYYIRQCLLHKRCAVCGRPAELHHVDHVGMGRDRNEINHLGMRALPLCRIHHEEAHRIGEKTFEKKYKFEGIAIDSDIAKTYKLRCE